ncbi:MAG: hypothetical protein H7X79_14120 [Sporomusaceae bacterium]|nr:hypothetical protein [Sporomusaceae bacterium]
MPRKTSRRSANYSKQNDGQQSNEQEEEQQGQQQEQQSDRYENKANDTDSLIADMAQGFIQAQSKLAGNTASINNMEIALLLQKVNNQLEEMKNSAQSSGPKSEQNKQGSNKQDSGSQNTSGMKAQDNSQGAEEGPSQELQALLSSVLQGKSNKGNSEGKSSNKQSNSAEKSNLGKNQQNTMAVQTVSQVLAQAQYELANELEASLKKLKQVISESEKLANNISNLLGEETAKKS